MAYIARNPTKKGYHNLTPAQDEQRKRENAIGCAQYFQYLLECKIKTMPEYSKSEVILVDFRNKTREQIDAFIKNCCDILKIKQFGKL